MVGLARHDRIGKAAARLRLLAPALLPTAGRQPFSLPRPQGLAATLLASEALATVAAFPTARKSMRFAALHEGGLMPVGNDTHRTDVTSEAAP